MKKRSGDGGGNPSSSPDPDPETLIHENSLFFDRLVDLIPARFYLPAPDEDRVPYPFLSKPEKMIAREKSRENTKNSRRNRFDPKKPSSTLDLLQQNLDAEKSESAADQNPRPLPDERHVTYEELRQRLRRRIEELSSTRNTRPDENRPNKRIKNRGDPVKGKRKRDENSVIKAAKESSLPPADISFGQVKLDEKARKKKKLPKAQALDKARRLEAAKKDPEKGERVAKKHSWKAAESRAAGEKVHDQPKLLAESIRKEKRRRQKHAEQWKERVQSREALRNEKQKKRADNIKGRIEDKKKRRIEKREKKLMRPGFEGRKEGFINN